MSDKHLYRKFYILFLFCLLSVSLSAQKIASTVEEKELLEAVSENFQTLAERLLNEGGNANLTDSYGQSLLMFAARNNNKELASLLIEKGAKVNYRIKHKSEYNSDKNAFAMLMLQNLTVLDYGIASKDISMVNFLIDAGAKLDIKNKDLGSTVATASQRGNTKMVRYLLSKGAQVSDETGRNLIVWHIITGPDPIYGITKTDKNTDFSLIKIWDDYGISLDNEKLLSSPLVRTEKHRKNIVNYMAAYREWIESGAKISQKLEKESYAKPIPKIVNEDQLDQAISEASKRHKEYEERILKEKEEAEQKYYKVWIVVFISLGVIATLIIQRHRLQALWVSVSTILNTSPASNNRPVSVIIKPRQPSQSKPANNRVPKQEKEKKTKAGQIPITAKGWTVDDTIGIEVLYLTIEDMINPINLRNEHERAVREMIWYIRRLEKISEEEATNMTGEKELVKKLNSLWKSIDPNNVRDIYKRSLYLLVENYSKQDKKVESFLNQIRVKK